MTEFHKGPIAAASGLVVRQNKVLLIRRKNAPDQGAWGLPGGKIDWGETVAQTVVREVWEETSVRCRPVEPLGFVEVLDRAEAGGIERHFLIAILLCETEEAEVVAGDDAVEAGWFTREEVSLIPTFQTYDVVSLIARVLPDNP